MFGFLLNLHSYHPHKHMHTQNIYILSDVHAVLLGWHPPSNYDIYKTNKKSKGRNLLSSSLPGSHCLFLATGASTSRRRLRAHTIKPGWKWRLMSIKCQSCRRHQWQNCANSRMTSIAAGGGTDAAPRGIQQEAKQSAVQRRDALFCFVFFLISAVEF